jgi:hypothetical protein
MAGITILSVTFSPMPVTDQLVSVHYKLGSDPDVTGSYTHVTPSTTVHPDGTLAPSVDIPGLTPGVTYTVKVMPLCGGNYATENFTIE